MKRCLSLPTMLALMFVALFVLALALSARSSAQTLPSVIQTATYNGHTYYLLSSDNWTNSEAAAEALGGHLATIYDVDENNFVYNTFTNGGTIDRGLWIGMKRAGVGSARFVWVDGEPQCGAFFPNLHMNYDPSLNYIGILPPSDPYAKFWYHEPDLAAPSGVPFHGVVKVGPAKPDPISVMESAIYNGHTYYLLSSCSWTDSEAFAQTLGGHLVTINGEAENDFVYDTFTHNGTVNQFMWIGLNDVGHKWAYTWVSGEPVTYTRWSEGSPQDPWNVADYAGIFYPSDFRASYWYSNPDWPGLPGSSPAGIQGGGVVEVPYIAPVPPSRYTVSGRVLIDSLQPISGVSVSSSAGVSATTDANGYYILSNPVAGSTVLTPSKGNYTFGPASRTVTGPPDVTGQDFTATSVPQVLQSASYNGHTYYLLASDTWTHSEAVAQMLGGHLVTINDEDENAFVYYTFTGNGTLTRALWIGLNDAVSEANFVWASGEPVTYTRWAYGEPSNSTGNEDYVHIFYPGESRASYWNDAPDLASQWGAPFFGVVEVPFPPTPTPTPAPLPELSVGSSDITFSPVNPGPGASVTIDADITNQGRGDALNVEVGYYDFDVPIALVTIPRIDAGASVHAFTATAFPDAGFRLITVKVDPHNVIIEQSETNNEASQVLQVGHPDFSAAAVNTQVSAALACPGAIVWVHGQAFYDFASIPGQQDFPLKGGMVTLKVMQPPSNSILGVFAGAHTDASGSFSQGTLAPEVAGTYPFTVEVTDGTVIGSTQGVLTVQSCGGPTPTSTVTPTSTPTGTLTPTPSPTPTPTSTPEPPRNVYVHSEDIRFSNDNPQVNETMAILARLHYIGTEALANLPVTISDLFPVGGVLYTFRIGRSLASFPNVGPDTPMVVLDWTNTAEGDHIIQVTLDPPFAQYTGDDQATRLIRIGSPDQSVVLHKSVELLGDADGNGRPSPGDTLRYTLTLTNTSSDPRSNAVLIDNYDIKHLNPPYDVTDDGVVSGGSVTWRFASVSTGESRTLTYKAQIKPCAEFPPGSHDIINTAMLTTDQTAPVAAQATVTVSNSPPDVRVGQATVHAGEGSVARNSGTVSDADNDPVALRASIGAIIDNRDGTWSWSLPTTDGPLQSQLVTVIADDGHCGVKEVPFSLTVDNVLPTVHALVSPEPSNEGAPVIASAGFSDPGPNDAAFTCTVNYGDGSGDMPGTVGASANTCSGPVHVYVDEGSYAVTVSVTDKDGGTGSDSVTHNVNNVAPSNVTLSVSPNPVDENGTAELSGSFVDPGTNDTHTVTVNWGLGEGSTTLQLPPGQLSFIAPHQYLDDNPSGTPSDLYSITVDVTDDDGGTGSGSVPLTVKNVAPVVVRIQAVPGVMAVNSSTTLTADFTDVGSWDTHVCTFSWGDGQPDTSVSAPATGNGSCTALHTYAATGVYTVGLTVVDDDTGQGTSQFQFVVVYDPNGGFVTGGGWINSPIGAYSLDPTSAGKASFGFVSKYLKGATAPTGQTEFQSHAINFNFHSDSYDWLVVAGARAQYKGTGTVNGQAGYGFLLTAIDGQITGGGGIDRFRIKIWDKGTGNVVYDNQMGAADDADPATAIQGGSIVIQKAK